MKLPELKDCIIVHYGCELLNKKEHLIYSLAGISHEPNKEYHFGDNTVTSGGPKTETEITIIEEFENYIKKNRNKTIIHWSMQKPDWGFQAIASRYYQLTNKKINLDIKDTLDLSEYLKSKYGYDYIKKDGGRLNHLAKKNGFSGFMEERVIKTKHDNSCRIELLFSIVQAELQGKLKTDTKQMPKLNEALISFSSNDTLDKVYEALKGYFKGNEAKFRMALEGKKLDIHLLFPSNQNKFVDVFLRLKYSGFLLSKPKEIKEWLCSNFVFQYHRGDIKEVRKFNPSTVNDILTKEKGLPSKRERIKIDWLPNIKL